MIVWGGAGDSFYFNSGGRYNPGTDTWVPTTGIAPYPRKLHTAVWTGTQMIIWGGDSDAGLLDTGGRYQSHIRILGRRQAPLTHPQRETFTPLCGQVTR